MILLVSMIKGKKNKQNTTLKGTQGIIITSLKMNDEKTGIPYNSI